MCDGCEPGTFHDGAYMQPPTRLPNTQPVRHYEQPGLSGGVRIPLKPGQAPPDPNAAQQGFRVSDMLMLGPGGMAMLDPSKLPAEAGPFMMLANMLLRIELEVTAMRNAIVARGLMTEQEFLAALRQAHQTYNSNLSVGMQQLDSRPPAPPAARQPVNAADPRRSPANVLVNDATGIINPGA